MAHVVFLTVLWDGFSYAVLSCSFIPFLLVLLVRTSLDVRSCLMLLSTASDVHIMCDQGVVVEKSRHSVQANSWIIAISRY